MSICSGTHRERLFIGEAGFRGVTALLDKHQRSHPNLGESIIATELMTFGRTADHCPACQTKLDEADDETLTSLAIANLFIEEGQPKTELFCSERCERIRSLQNRGVTVILGFDGTLIHRSVHPTIAGKKFSRIHWNCPHDGSSFTSQTLPPIITRFFQSARQVQQSGDRIHVTLAQPEGKEGFYQGYIYNIRDAAKSNGYLLYAKRPFGSTRYPGYVHEQTKVVASAAGANTLREFVFIRGNLPEGRLKANVRTAPYYGFSRESYVRNTDDESSGYSASEAEEAEA